MIQGGFSNFTSSLFCCFHIVLKNIYGSFLLRFPILFPYLTLTFSSLYFAPLVPILHYFYSTPSGFSSLEGSPDSFTPTRGLTPQPASLFRLPAGPWHPPTNAVRKTLLILSCCSQIGLKRLPGNTCWTFRGFSALEFARFPITCLCSLPSRHQ